MCKFERSNNARKIGNQGKKLPSRQNGREHEVTIDCTHNPSDCTSFTFGVDRSSNK